MSPQRIRARLAYFGGPFAGWQRQINAPTVQGELEVALARLYGRAVPAVAAGRTDAGVHADGQVVHFDAPLAIPLRGVRAALNSLLPAEIRVLAVHAAGAGFDARRSARRKRYRYRLAWGEPLLPVEALRRLLLPTRPDLAALARAAALVPGTRDIAAFALAGHAGTGARGTVRTITACRLIPRGRRLDLVVEGDGFLRGQVRRIVGALIDVGRGAASEDWFASLLAGGPATPPAPTAPARGLTLERVFYAGAGTIRDKGLS